MSLSMHYNPIGVPSSMAPLHCECKCHRSKHDDFSDNDDDFAPARLDDFSDDHNDFASADAPE
jgi:hypothetical protein